MSARVNMTRTRGKPCMPRTFALLVAGLVLAISCGESKVTLRMDTSVNETLPEEVLSETEQEIASSLPQGGAAAANLIGYTTIPADRSYSRSVVLFEQKINVPINKSGSQKTLVQRRCAAIAIGHFSLATVRHCLEFYSPDLSTYGTYQGASYAMDRYVQLASPNGTTVAPPKNTGVVDSSVNRREIDGWMNLTDYSRYEGVSVYVKGTFMSRTDLAGWGNISAVSVCSREIRLNEKVWVTGFHEISTGKYQLGHYEAKVKTLLRDPNDGTYVSAFITEGTNPGSCLEGGDSGGGVFLLNGDAYCLAGLNVAYGIPAANGCRPSRHISTYGVRNRKLDSDFERVIDANWSNASGIYKWNNNFLQ